MTTPWAAPTPPGAPPRAEGQAGSGTDAADDVPPLRRDVAAGLLTGVVLVLLGAPAGLLWSAISPRVTVVLGSGGPGLADPTTRAFVGADVAFGLVVLGVGLVCGVVAFWLGRRHGPAVVLGLLVGGLVAAYVAAETGERVGLQAFQAALEDVGRRGTLEASLRLRASEAMVLWPVGALTAFAATTAVRTPPQAPSGARRGRAASGSSSG